MVFWNYAGDSLRGTEVLEEKWNEVLPGIKLLNSVWIIVSEKKTKLMFGLLYFFCEQVYTLSLLFLISARTRISRQEKLLQYFTKPDNIQSLTRDFLLWFPDNKVLDKCR